jgi:hypothetical protein
MPPYEFPLTPDATGRVFFEYVAPQMPTGTSAVLRPSFTLLLQPPDSNPVVSTQTARSPTDCVFRFPPEDPNEYDRHCFGDPNFPVVYAGYDFRRAIGFHSNGSPAPLTDAKYEAVDDMTEGEIQTFLVDHRSQLANLYFVGDPASFETTEMSGVYGTDPSHWPAAYIACGLVYPPGQCPNGAFDAQTSWPIWPPGYGQDPPVNGYRGVSFAHILWYWCNSYTVNPRVMLTHLQTEQTLIKGPTAESVSYTLSHIGKMLSYGLNLVPSTRWPSVQIAGGVVTARTWFDSAPEAIPDSPHTDPSHLLRIAGYSPRPLSCTATDHNTRFTLSSGVDVPAALFSHTRAAWALFKYTTQVNSCRCGGGNHLFMETWTGYGFDQ